MVLADTGTKEHNFTNHLVKIGKEKGVFPALLLGIVPIISIIVYCFVQGHGFWEASILTSEWNDELFYYKLVEGAIAYGNPLGYFGFNESHALVGSFAAWSPILLWPWLIWGKLFGWGLSSPFWCNLFLYCLAMFLFGLLTKPSRKQTLATVLIFMLFPLNARYILSTMPEIICFSMVIVFYGLAIRYQRLSYVNTEEGEVSGHSQKMPLLVILLILCVVMTLMRPYLLLFLLLPLYFLIRDYRWKGLVPAVLILGGTGVLYALIKHYLSAEYFNALFSTDWITNFFERGFLGGLRGLAGIVYYKGHDFFAYVIQGFLGNSATGAFFDSSILVTLLLFYRLVWCVVRRKHRDREELQKGPGDLTVIWLFAALSFAAMGVALLLMYKPVEGSKHLLTFLASAILLFPIGSDVEDGKKSSWQELVLPVALFGAFFIYLFMLSEGMEYEHSIPFITHKAQEREAYWEDIFRDEIRLNRENVPSYENAVIWMFADVPVEKADVYPYAWESLDWQILYALPTGTGISCCTQLYVTENLGKLQCKYLCVPCGGVVEQACLELGYTQIGRDDTVVVFRLYD